MNVPGCGSIRTTPACPKAHPKNHLTWPHAETNPPAVIALIGAPATPTVYRMYGHRVEQPVQGKPLVGFTLQWMSRTVHDGRSVARRSRWKNLHILVISGGD